MVRWQHSASNLEGLREQDAFCIEIRARHQGGEGGERTRGLLVLVAIHAAVPVEGLLKKAARARFVVGSVQDPAERVQRLERIRVIGTDQPALLCQRFLEGLARRRVLAALGVDEAEHLLQLRPDHRRIAQLREGAGLGACKELANGHPIAIRANRWIGGLEQIDEHAHDLFRLVLLEPRDAALLGERTRLQRSDDAEGRDAADEYRRGRNREAVPAHELARTVAEGVGLGEHGAPGEEAFNLLAQLTRRRVAALGFVAQRRQDDAVEVAANPSDEPAAVGDV